MFEPRTPLESAIRAGDADATLALLRAETEEQRSKHRAGLMRMLKLVQAARWNDKDPREWGRHTEAQERCLAMAIFMCGKAEDVVEARVGDDLIEQLGSEFHPRSLDGLADAMLKRSPYQIHSVQRLIVNGLAQRPDTDDYAIGLIALPSGARDGKVLASMFKADPGLARSLLRVFDVEGTADVSLTSSDKFNKFPELAWNKVLFLLVDDGVTTRAELLDRTLGALEKDWPQYRAGWFSRFHGQLEPDDATMRAQLPRYLALCASRIPPTVALALDTLKKLDLGAPLDGKALLGGLRPVMASSVKGQLDVAIKLIDRVVKREPALATEASSVIAMGLLHEAATVQASVLQRIEAWGSDAATRAHLAEFATAVAATNRPRLQQLIGTAAQVAPSAVQPPAASPSQQVDPLDDARRLAPVADLHELVESIAHVFENANDVDAFERVVAELVRIAPIADDDKPLFAPVRKRAVKMQKLLPRELARLLLFVLDGTRTSGQVGKDHGGNASTLEGLLNERIDALMDVAAQGRHLDPLSAPTHRGGFIAPEVFIDRVAAHRSMGLVSSELEQVVGLLRLATGSAPALRSRARALPDDAFTRVLRYALGDDVPPGAERDLFAAAARIRHPRADDTALDARHPGLGPDAALAARHSWHVHTRDTSGGYTFHDLLVESQLPPTDLPCTRPAVLRHPPTDEARAHYRWWSFAGIDEGAIRCSATLLPSDPEAFFAEGARAIGNNLDWWEAQWQNRAYLELLLDPATRMTPMANLLLVLGLSGKEPGQTAIAVDALVRAHAEGRLESAALAETVRALLATPLIKAARLHRSLQAAMRADAQVHTLVFDLLCAAVQARPGDPPKDTALLLDLLIELKVDGGRVLPDAARAALSDMKLTGRANTLRRSLLT
jgi:hypothetical protein